MSPRRGNDIVFVIRYHLFVRCGAWASLPKATWKGRSEKLAGGNTQEPFNSGRCSRKRGGSGLPAGNQGGSNTCDHLGEKGVGELTGSRGAGAPLGMTLYFPFCLLEAS